MTTSGEALNARPAETERGLTTQDQSQVHAPVLDSTLILFDKPGRGPTLRGWRCGSCGRLAFGVKSFCPTCGAREGRETRLETRGRLETWSRVLGQTEYIVGYCLVGDGEDDQEVRVFAPIDVADESVLRPGQTVEIRLRVSTLRVGERLHQYFVPADSQGESA